MTGGFGRAIAAISIFTSLEWLCGFAVFALAVFWLRTRMPRAYLRSE